MIRLLIAGLLLSALWAGPAMAQLPGNPPPSCNQSVVYDNALTGATKIISGVPGKITYVCGYVISANGAVGAGLVYGTGTNCATGRVLMTPVWQLVAQTHIDDVSPYWRGMSAPASNDVCINASAAIAVETVVYFGQY
jgi:hypothetical protein